MMAIHLIRTSDAKPIANSAESGTSPLSNGAESDQQDEPRIDELLNAVEDFVGRLDDDAPPARHEQQQQRQSAYSMPVVAKREEALVSSAGINQLAHAVGIHPRSALNKNFIRFGRSSHYHLRRAQAIEKLRRYIIKFY